MTMPSLPGFTLPTHDLWLQITVLCLTLLASLWLTRLVKQRLDQKGAGQPFRHALTLSRRDFLRLFTPPLALVITLIVSALINPWADTSVLTLAQPLLLSLAVVQFVFYVLRRILKPSTLLSSLEHIVAWLVWGVVALHLTGHLPALISTLDEIGVTVGKNRISLYTTVLGILTLSVTVLVALWIARSIETRFIEQTPLQGNLKSALSKAARTLLVLLAVLVALPVMGIDITMLSVFGGALGVGIGLGLQKIVANYFAGFTLLLDQSIRMGDMVTVNGRFGEVEDIRTRYTVIRGRDRSETIIPNEVMVTSVVINHTLADRENRLQLPVQVAYATDLNVARDAMVAAANTHARVIKPTDTHVRLVGFGESGIDLELVCWISDPENGLGRLKSDINWSIWASFKREGIEIPYPQRVVTLQNAI